MAKQTIPGKAPISLAPVKALSEPKPAAPEPRDRFAESQPRTMASSMATM